jgi:type II secretory ATPase GspE/PulE/Tfp pilus assembly ATPase PilB-like protein
MTMLDTSTIAARVLDALSEAGVVSSSQVTSARDSASSDAEAGRSLLAQGLITPEQLSEVLEEEMGTPRVDLSSYAPDDDALERVPGHIAKKHRVLPLFEIEGMLTVAIGDPADVFELDAVAAELSVEIEMVLTDAAAVSSSIEQFYPDGEAAAPTESAAVAAPEPSTPAAVPAGAPGLPTTGVISSQGIWTEDEIEAAASLDMSPEGVAGSAGAEAPEDTNVYFDGVPVIADADDLEISAADFFDVADEMPIVVDAPEAISEEAEYEEPAWQDASLIRGVEDVVSETSRTSVIDLDVLAVADERKLSVLIADILEHAVARGANRIHLLPYKSDFFLVFRIQGRLEKIASAPLSMQGPLIEGFKHYAKLGGVTADLPALGRLHADIGGKSLVLTVSSVPTVAGQRLVVSISATRPQPRGFVELGMGDAEARALQTMVERGRGILLVAAPVAGGRSGTYYALLNHAAQVGKTVYSVERSIEHEIPAVAQVLVNPGSPVGAASYFAAGMRQDTDMLAIDSIQTVEDVHLAIEAASMGRLVIATFAGADIVTAVRRMLHLGAEPVSLASALTLGIGQRVARTNCPHCLSEEFNALAAKIPGAEPGMSTSRGMGCPECGQTGFSGATGIFEVLPFTEPVRAQIAQDASAAELAAAARAAGMRPMIASGLAKVREGLISVDELDRVLRFSALG